uniref:Uncharacterized protein n=1 Tax=Terrapene triunguis TaxID=2587831 RepID=A0A674IHC5_9SAUR
VLCACIGYLGACLLTLCKNEACTPLARSPIWGMQGASGAGVALVMGDIGRSQHHYKHLADFWLFPRVWEAAAVLSLENVSGKNQPPKHHTYGLL